MLLSIGFVSLRNVVKGTIFIQKFCELLDKHGKDNLVENIFKQVIRELTEGPNA